MDDIGVRLDRPLAPGQEGNGLMCKFAAILYPLAFCIVLALTMCAVPASGTTLDIESAWPGTSPTPVMKQDTTYLFFQVYLYDLNSQHQQQPATDVATQTYTIDAGSNATIRYVSVLADVTTTISPDGHSATVTISGGNYDAELSIEVCVTYANPGDEQATYSGTATLSDGTNLNANGSITVHVEDFELSADPASLNISLATESGADSVITVTPYNGFTGDVSLSLSYLDANGNELAGAPTGISYVFTVSPVSITDAASQSSGLGLCPCQPGVCPAPGSYTLVVTGTYTRPSDGSIVTRKTDIGLTITTT